MPLHCISGDIELLIKQGQKVPEEKLTRLDDVLKTIKKLHGCDIFDSEKTRKFHGALRQLRVGRRPKK